MTSYTRWSGAVDLIYYHDDPVAQLQGLGQHEAGLRHGALRGVHQQDDAVDHLQDALHLAAEVGVARSIHDVDLHILILDGGVLGKDGDAPLALQVVGVHNALHHGLIFPVHAGLLEHLIHQSGLAMVNVGNYGNISQFFVLHHFSSYQQYGKTTRGPIADGGAPNGAYKLFVRKKKLDAGGIYFRQAFKYLGSLRGIRPAGRPYRGRRGRSWRHVSVFRALRPLLI